MIGLGVGMAAAGAVAPQINNMFKGFNAAPQAATAVCAKCGATVAADAKFCSVCGEKMAVADAATITCPECGKIVTSEKFCPECGHKFVSACSKCGATVPAGAKFCPECGEKI